MDYHVAQLLEKLIIATGTLGGLGIAAWTIVQMRRHRSAALPPGLSESIDRLRESMEAMREEMADMAERLEFTERILARLVDDGRPEQPQLPHH
jgi:hypothetical protein